MGFNDYYIGHGSFLLANHLISNNHNDLLLSNKNLMEEE